MKYWSDVCNDKFDTEEELLAAEKALQDAEKEKKEKEATISKQKKQLANEIAECDNAIDEAFANREEVKKKCAEILENSNKQVEELLKEANDAINKAKTSKYDKIAEFNNKFGSPYTVSYTGEKAEKEFKRLQNELSNYGTIFDSLISRFF